MLERIDTTSDAVSAATELVERYGYVARAYAHGRLCECLYECDEAGIDFWETVARKLDLLAKRAPDLLSIANYLRVKANEQLEPEEDKSQAQVA